MNQPAGGDQIEEQINDQGHRPASNISIQERRLLDHLGKIRTFHCLKQGAQWCVTPQKISRISTFSVTPSILKLKGDPGPTRTTSGLAWAPAEDPSDPYSAALVLSPVTSPIIWLHLGSHPGLHLLVYRHKHGVTRSSTMVHLSVEELLLHRDVLSPDTGLG